MELVQCTKPPLRNGQELISGSPVLVTAENTTTVWQHVEIGIMAGCTIGPLAFVKSMELI